MSVLSGPGWTTGCPWPQNHPNTCHIWGREVARGSRDDSSPQESCCLL
ncbi:LOW QUALITY PROTEIN: ST3GAL4 isoform 20, partial [Pongo abelii]